MDDRQTASPLSVAESGPAVGVVIPTFNRAAVLLQCLRSLERQTFKNFEVIVVDDGSTDDTQSVLATYQPSSPYPLLCLLQRNAGPAAARNLAISRLTAPLAVLIGDDTFPEPAFLQAHFDFHRRHTGSEMVAVGLTLWEETQQVVTPLMRWLGTEGVQFAFRELLEGTPADWRHFYTSNLSAATAYLLRNPFDTSFNRYGYEDIELGYRLFTQGNLTISFLADAVNRHLHPVTYTKTCERARIAGAAAHHFAEMWPEQRLTLPSGIKGLLLRVASEPHLILPLLTAFGRLLTSFWCPNPLLPRVLQCQSIAGYTEAAARQPRRQEQ